MTEFSTAFSTAEDWAHVAKELSDGLSAADSRGGGLGLLYVSDVLSEDFPSIVTYLKQTSDVKTWIGTIGYGVISGPVAAFERPAAAAMVLDISSDHYRLVPVSPIPGSSDPELAAWIETVSPTSGIMHADGAMPSLADLVESVSERSGAYLVGGLTCSRGAQHQVAGDVGVSGVSGAVFAPDVAVTAGLSQGCSPLGPVREVTAGEANIIAELDGRPALEVFNEDIGEILARDLQRVAGYVHVAFPVSGSDTADYLVRSLVGIDPEHGWLAVGSDVATGDRVMFVRRDPASARKDLERMLRDVRSRMPGAARGALYVSCVARGPSMFGEEAREAEIVSNELAGIPVVGFYANGEICHDRLYGYTGVIMVFG